MSEFAYVRNGDANVRGNVHKIDLADLANYLFDPIRVPVFNEAGEKIGSSWLPANWPMRVQVPAEVDTPEEVRKYRQKLEDEGFVFQFTEVDEDEYNRDHN